MLRPFTHDGPAGAPTPPDPAPEGYSDAACTPQGGEEVMARPRRGEVRRRPTAQGVAYSIRFSYAGERHTVHLGGDWEGWNEARVERERQFLMEKVSRGEWMPRPPRPVELGLRVPSFQLEASRWLEREAAK